MSEYTKGTWTLNDRTGEVLSGNHKIGEVYGATIHNHEDNHELKNHRRFVSLMVNHILCIQDRDYNLDKIARSPPERRV